MNRQKLTDLIQHPERISARDSAMLSEMAEQYPYATVIQILLAKSMQHHAQARTQLATAALYTPNRSVLRLVMENTLPGTAPTAAQEATPPPTEPDRPEEPAAVISLKTSPLMETSHSELPEPKEDIFDELQKNLRRLRQERSKHLGKTGENDSPKGIQTLTTDQAEAIDSQEGTSFKGMPPTVQQLITDHEQQSLENPKIQAQRSLIDSFLKNAPNLQRRQQLGEVPNEETTDLSQTANTTPLDLATETLASIMEKQGKTDKAIDIYQKLLLKYPGKSAYFANCIERLKKEL